MPALHIVLEDQESILDLDNLMLSELEVLEEHAGIDLEQLNDEASLRKVRFLGHLLWLVKLRRIAAEQQIPLSKAALVLPRSDFDVPAGSVEAKWVAAPKDRPATRTRTTRTPPTGSSRPRKLSAKNASGKSAASPKSSTSDPGKSAD